MECKHSHDDEEGEKEKKKSRPWIKTRLTKQCLGNVSSVHTKPCKREEKEKKECNRFFVFLLLWRQQCDNLQCS